MTRQEGTYAYNFSVRSLTLRTLSLALVMLALSAASLAQFRVAITFGPPALPVYEQPICPGEGYIWTPGYWYWDDDAEDYYWVPGTWVLAPELRLPPESRFRGVNATTSMAASHSPRPGKQTGRK